MTLSFELRRARHAIGEFNATLSFYQPVGARAFAEAVTKLGEVARRLNLPAPMNMQVVTFNVEGGVPKPAISDGAGWQRFAPHGESALSIFCDRDSIQLSCRDYSNWQEMLPTIVNCFSAIAPAYMTDVPAIKAFTIRYLNEFRSAEPGYVSVAEMLREGNYWVPPFAFDVSEPWHGHVGLFEEVTAQSRRLIQVNFTCGLGQMPDRPSTFTVVNALILVSENYDIAGAQPLTVSTSDLEGVLVSHFEKAHAREKKVLAELFSDSYLGAMGALPA